MNPEQFIEKHPSLEGKGSADGSYTYFDYLTIEATQLDKQKVKEAIEKLKSLVLGAIPTEAETYIDRINKVKTNTKKLVKKEFDFVEKELRLE